MKKTINTSPVIKTECDRPMAEKKGYLSCNEDCRKCMACILTRANGEREHVYLR